MRPRIKLILEWGIEEYMYYEEWSGKMEWALKGEVGKVECKRWGGINVS